MTFENDYLFGLLKTLLTTFMTLLLMFALTDFKYSKKRVLAIYAVYFAYVGLSSWLLINFLGWMNFTRVFVFSISAPAALITYRVATDHAMQAVFNYATQIDIALILSMTGTLLNTAWHGNKVTDLLLRIALFSAALLLEYHYMRGLFRKVADNLQKNWLHLAAVPIVFGLLFLLFGLFPAHFTESIWNVIYVYMAAIVMAVVYVVVFQSMTDSYALLEAQRENDLLEAQAAALKKQAEAMARDFFQPEDIRYCDHPVLNDIFSFYLGLAKKDGISVSASLDVPEKLPVDAILLATVFANAIENARDVLNQYPKDRERHLELRCVSRPKFIFEIANTCLEPVEFDEEGYPVGKNHHRGVRTQSILAFAKQNNQILDYEVSGGMFRLKLLIQGIGP